MIEKVQKNLQELNMISPGDRVLVAVSGGADSVCLLLVLQSLSKSMGFSLEAIHVEHGIRGDESLADADFVQKLCERLRVPSYRANVDVPAYCKNTGIGTEEAARILRYNVFAKLAKEYNAKIALAHHMEDNAETILFQMVRGSSLNGLCGMQPIREDEQGVVYIRPLLNLHREEIEEFLKTKGQEFCVDSTNKELEYSRNYLRGMVLPQLKEVNAKAVDHINETAAKLSDVKDFLEEETSRMWAQVVEVFSEEKRVCIDSVKILDAHVAIQKEIIYRGIAQVMGTKKDISSVHVESVLALCDSQSGKEVSLPNGVIAKKEYDNLWIVVKDTDELELSPVKEPVAMISEEMLTKALVEKNTLEISLGSPDEKIEIRVFPYHGKSAEIPKKPYTKWFDYDKMRVGFCIRNRCSGDYFISDAFGHRKKVKQYFIDEKISSTKREGMWLLAQDHLVFWLIGGRISEHLKVTEETKTIVEILYKGDI